MVLVPGQCTGVTKFVENGRRLILLDCFAPFSSCASDQLSFPEASKLIASVFDQTLNLTLFGAVLCHAFLDGWSTRGDTMARIAFLPDGACA